MIILQRFDFDSCLSNVFHFYFLAVIYAIAYYLSEIACANLHLMAIYKTISLRIIIKIKKTKKNLESYKQFLKKIHKFSEFME